MAILLFLDAFNKKLGRAIRDGVRKNNNCLGPPDLSLRLIVDNYGDFLHVLEMVICVGCIYSTNKKYKFNGDFHGPEDFQPYERKE